MSLPRWRPAFNLRLQNVYIPVTVLSHFPAILRVEQAKLFSCSSLFSLSFTNSRQGRPKTGRPCSFYIFLRASARFMVRLRSEDQASLLASASRSPERST